MKKVILGLTAILLLSACAHTLRHGTVAMKESDTMAHVSIHNAKVGDKVVLFHNVCTGSLKVGGRSCERREIAEGIVKNVYNEHYSLVEFPAGTKFGEGDFVEEK